MALGQLRQGLQEVATNTTGKHRAAVEVVKELQHVGLARLQWVRLVESANLGDQFVRSEEGGHSRAQTNVHVGIEELHELVPASGDGAPHLFADEAITHHGPDEEW